VAAGNLALFVGVLGCSPSSPTPVDPYPNGPTILCPAAPTPVVSPNSQPVSVPYGTPAAVGGAPPVSTSCTPASGSLFPVGTTKVTCTGVDTRQRTGTCSFDVVVQATPVISMTQFVAFGDSITWGEDGDPEVLCGSNNNATPQSFGLIRPRVQVQPESAQYPGALRQKLAARYTTQAGQLLVDNAGQPGEPAAPLSTLGRFQSVLRSKPYEAVLLMEGTNDIFYGDPTQIAPAINGLNNMINEAKRQRVRPFLATVPPMVPGGTRACGNRLVAPLDDQIRALAAAQGVTLVDVYAGMGSSYAQYFGPDGLHPNVAGYDNIATTFFNALKTALEVTPTTTAMPTRFGVPTQVSPRSPVRPQR
jgi:lysophospholipase L1-like esterase